MEEKTDIQDFDSIVNIWKIFCELHFNLFELTGDEYSALLLGDIERLEHLTLIKNEVVKKIESLELQRQKLIYILQDKHPKAQLVSVSDLITFFNSYAPGNLTHYFQSFNSLLKDLIEKVKEQNKKNQLFLNKAIFHLQDLRESATGKKNNPTYNSLGKMALLPSSR